MDLSQNATFDELKAKIISKYKTLVRRRQQANNANANHGAGKGKGGGGKGAGGNGGKGSATGGKGAQVLQVTRSESCSKCGEEGHWYKDPKCPLFNEPCPIMIRFRRQKFPKTAYSWLFALA